VSHGAASALPGQLPELPALTAQLSAFASAFLQTTRLLKLTFAADSGVPANLLLPHRLTGREAINEGFRYELEVVSSDAALELKTLLGLPVAVAILADAGGDREICGLVTEVSQLGSDGGFATYRLVIESALAVLAHRRTSRVFTQTDARTLTMQLVRSTSTPTRCWEQRCAWTTAAGRRAWSGPSGCSTTSPISIS